MGELLGIIHGLKFLCRFSACAHREVRKNAEYLLTLPEFAWADEFFFQSLFFWRTNKGPTWLQCSALKYQIIWIWMGIETVCFVYIMEQQRTRRVAFNMCARQKHRKREKNWRLAGRRKIGNNFQSEFHLKWFSSGVVWAELKFIYRRKKRKKKKIMNSQTRWDGFPLFSLFVLFLFSSRARRDFTEWIRLLALTWGRYSAV